MEQYSPYIASCMLRESAELLQGSHKYNSVVRASTIKVGGFGFDSLPMHFFLQFVSILIYH